VIPTYRRRAGLRVVVDAVAADRYPSDIIVVVDGSDDGSMELLTSMRETEPRLRPMWQDNQGQGAARRTGVRHATGEVVLLLDDDVIAGPGLAAGHARVHAGVAKAVVLGYMPTIRPTPRRAGDFTSYLYAEDYERACEAYERDPDSVITHLWAGNMSLRRADALAVGLDGGPGLVRHEDQAFGLRCARAGLRGVFDRSLAARHAHRQDVAAFGRQFWHQGRSRRVLSVRYPEFVPDLDPYAELPARMRPVIGSLAGTHRVSLPALRGGVKALGKARLWPGETALARVLRQVELIRGYRSA